MLNAPLEGRYGCAVFEYDFDKHGGAVGDIVVTPKLIPKGAIVWGPGIIHVKTAVTSGGAATVAIQLASSEDILAATAKTSLTLNAMLDTVCDGTAANAIRLTAAAQLTFTVAVDTLTAGVIAVVLPWTMTA